LRLGYGFSPLVFSGGCGNGGVSRKLARLEDTAGVGVFDVSGGRVVSVGADRPEKPQIEALDCSVRTAPDGRIFAGLVTFFPKQVRCYSSECDLLAKIELSEEALAVAVAPTGRNFLLRFPDRLQLIEFSGKPVWSYGIRRDTPTGQANKVIQDEHVYHGRELDTDLFFTQSLTWEPTGRHFAWSDRERVHVVRIDGLVESTSWLGRSPTWAPNGESVAYLRGERAFIRNVPAGPEMPLLPDGKFVFAIEWSPCSRFLLAREHKKCWWTKVKPLFLQEPTDCYPLVVIERGSLASAEVGDPAWGQGPHFFWLSRPRKMAV
jgi:hypothetical protein